VEGINRGVDCPDNYHMKNKNKKEKREGGIKSRRGTEMACRRQMVSQGVSARKKGYEADRKS